MNNLPLVSVIMPAYNSEAFILEAIQSVQGQTYKDWELMVIDDASTDSTPAVVEEAIAKDNRIHLIKNSENLGPGASRNSGIEAATGDFIAFLDADDLWLSKKLEFQLKYMEQKDLAMSYSSYLLMEENGTRTGSFVEALPVLTYNKLLRSNYVGNLTGIYNVKKLGKIYSPNLRKRQDWALWLQILKIVGETKGIQEPLAIYRMRKESLSNNKTALLSYNFRIYSEFLNFGFLKSCKYMSSFLWEHFTVKNKQVKELNK